MVPVVAAPIPVRVPAARPPQCPDSGELIYRLIKDAVQHPSAAGQGHNGREGCPTPRVRSARSVGARVGRQQAAGGVVEK